MTASPSSSPVDPLPRGFLLPALLTHDDRLYGRWDYLTAAWEAGELPPLSTAPIPRIGFLSTPDKGTWRMLTRCLDAIPHHGSGGWQGWSSYAYFRFFLEWLLYGFHHAGQPEPPQEPSGCEGASDHLYQALDLGLWLENPYDYFGDLLAQNAYGKRQGFYPTPHNVAEMMTAMMMGGQKSEAGEGADDIDCAADTRILTVCDPCVGTGRLLLHASNYSLRLYGQDIDPVLCLATLVNGYLFMPWLVRPIPYLDRVQYDPRASGAVSDSMTDQAAPQSALLLAGSEHDAVEQWRFEPIKKRKRAGAVPEPDLSNVRQGLLFEP